MTTVPLPRSPVTAVALALALVWTSGGCAVLADDGAHTCVSWVSFATPADALESAELAVTARVLGRDGTAPLYGVDAVVHEVSTAGLPVLKGADVASERLRVISTPTTCTGDDDDLYPAGDPLDTDDTVVLFLTRDEAGGDWRTLTPLHGVVPAGPGGELPATWAAPSGPPPAP